MGKDAHIDAVRAHDQPFDRICFPTIGPSLALAVSDEDLRDTLTAGIFQDGVDRIFTRHDFHVRAGLSRAFEIRLDDLLVGQTQVILFHVDGMQVAMKAASLALPAADHERGVRTRSYAYENALMRTVNLFDPVAAKICLELMIDNLRRKDQRDFPEFRELAFQLNRIGRFASYALRRAHHAILWRSIDNLDLIGRAKERFRDGFGHALSANILDVLLAFGDELQID
jgi:hypothetical protein